MRSCQIINRDRESRPRPGVGEVVEGVGVGVAAGGERVGEDPLPLDELLHHDAAAVVRRLSRHDHGLGVQGPASSALIISLHQL